MFSIFGFNSNWKLRHSGGKTADVNVKRQWSGDYSFQVPVGKEGKTVEICLTNYDKEGKKISGTVRDLTQEGPGQIEFSVETARKLQSVINEFYAYKSPPVWILYRGTLVL